MPEDQEKMYVQDGDLFTLYSNPFRFLYFSAKDLILNARQAKEKNDIEVENSYSIGAISLLLLSTEAFINRVYDGFLKDKFPQRINDEIESKWSITMKWYFAPLLFGSGNKTFDFDKEPWQSFSELKSIRDYFAHPKTQKLPIAISSAQQKTFDFVKGEIPRWPQTRVAKDLHHMKVEDAEKIFQIINKMIDDLDSFMGGVIKKDNWYVSEHLVKSAG